MTPIAMNDIFKSLFIFIIIVSILPFYIMHHKLFAPVPPFSSTNNINDNDNNNSRTNTIKTNPRPPNCTSEQLSIMKQQLPSDKCNEKTPPYFQKCSFLKATKCPKATWIDNYYNSIHEHAEKYQKSTSHFNAVYIGCNKGFDAVNAIRMGTANTKYNKKVWGNQMGETHGSVCNQNQVEDYGLNPSWDVLDGTVHCIEPMPPTVERLKLSAEQLGWTESFLVTGGAISKEIGEEYFQVEFDVGAENKGLDSCTRLNATYPDLFKERCIKVPVYSLDAYMNNIVKNGANGDTINLLSIDVEGFDFDVLLGGSETLQKTEYLEFEYNWMGSWANQKLIDAVKMLDNFSFTCYWAGSDMLWRIDESCWLDHFSWHAWSNIACVNRKLAVELTASMEETFINTLKQDITFG